MANVYLTQGWAGLSTGQLTDLDFNQALEIRAARALVSPDRAHARHIVRSGNGDPFWNDLGRYIRQFRQWPVANIYFAYGKPQ